MAELREGASARIAASGPHGTRSYEDLDVAARVTADRILEAKTDPDAPVALAFGLGAEGLVALHAAAEAGVAVALAHPGWRPREQQRFLETVGPDVVLCDPSVGWPGASEGRTVEAPGFPPVTLIRGTDARPASGRAPEGTEVLLWTSGSEGLPRVACHTWAGLLANAEASSARLDYSEEDRWLATLAWAHVGGLGVALRAAAVGGRVVFGPSRFETAATRSALDEATHVSLVPVMLDALLAGTDERAPARLRVALVGGAATPIALIRRARHAGWPVALTYGLTEAGSQVTVATPDEVEGRPDLAGTPLDSAEVRLAGDGEIEVRGASVFLGYLGEPARGTGAWFPTGDLGAWDPSGALRVTGRRSARIVTAGANVDPIEVESVLAGHPDVGEVCVVGVPSRAWGEVVTAVVAPRADVDDEAREELARRLDAWSREHLSGPRRPRDWRWVEALPRTANGKVDRRRVAEAAGERRTAE